MARTALTLTPALALLVATSVLPTAPAAMPTSTDPAPVSTAGTTTDAAAVTTLATTLLDHLDAGRFNEAEAMFTPDMRTAVPAAKLQQVWESLARNAGPAGPRGNATSTTSGELTTVAIALPYAKASLVARINIDRSSRVAGFLIQPAPSPAAAAAAAMDANAPYTEREARVGEGERVLPGTLALPKSASSRTPVPAVVLVHGSGAHDRDETIGPNRPFLDIARGLAAQGIAVLRYDKRTKARPQDFAGKDFSVDDEVTEDAVLAVDALRKVEGIDAKRIYILGHSLGGMLAPRIARQSGHVAGAVLLAAPARPVLDVLLEQIERQAMRDGSISNDERNALDDMKARVANVRNPGTVAATDTPLGQPVGYWRSLERIDPVADARKLALPLLLLHGGRDIQVVDADWKRWQTGLSGQRHARLRHYPATNHLGIAGEGPGTVEEYAVAGHVDAQLIDDIAAWIGEQ